MVRITPLTEEQIHDLEEGVQHLAAEGNPLALDLEMRLMECETPAERAQVLAQLDDDLRPAESAIKTMMQGFTATLTGTLGPALQHAVDEALPVIRQLYDRVWDAYRGAGMPYGEQEEGVQRWLSERSAVVAAREREEQRRLREWAAVDLRYHLQTGKHLPPPERDEEM